MAAMMDTDEDAELAMLGSEEDDEQTLRSFLDALPRDATKRDAVSRRSSPTTCPPAKLLLRGRCGRSTGRCARDALRAVSATKSGAQSISKEHALLFRGFAHGAPAVRKETCATVEALAKAGTTVQFCAAAASHVGKAAVDDDAGVAEAAANAARAVARAGFVDEAIAAVDEATREARGSLELVRACDVACGVAVACGDAAWDRRLIASTCLIACVGAAEDPLLRLAPSSSCRGLSRSRRAVQLICQSGSRNSSTSRNRTAATAATSRPCARLLECSLRPTPIRSRARAQDAASRGFGFGLCAFRREAATPTAPRTTCVRAWRWAGGSRAARTPPTRSIERHPRRRLARAAAGPKRCQAAALEILDASHEPARLGGARPEGRGRVLASHPGRRRRRALRGVGLLHGGRAVERTALVRLLSHAGVYEFLVSGPPPDDAIEAKRIKHAFVCAVAERWGGMDDARGAPSQPRRPRGRFDGRPGPCRRRSRSLLAKWRLFSCALLCNEVLVSARHTSAPPLHATARELSIGNGTLGKQQAEPGGR